MKKKEIQKLESIYWEIRRTMPFHIWISPQNEFERALQKSMEEFTMFLQQKKAKLK